MSAWLDNYETIPAADLVVHVGEEGHTFRVMRVLGGYRPISDDGTFEVPSALPSRDEAAEAGRDAISEAIHGPADAPIDYWPTTPAERDAAARAAHDESRDLGVG